MENETLPSGEELVNKVFSSVSFRGGKVLSFLYERNDTEKLYIQSQESGKCSFSIYGFNMEKVASEKCCVVSFKNGMPHIHLVLPFLDKNEEEKIISGENEEKILSITLNRLLEFGVEFESVQNSDKIAEFSFFVPFSVLYSCLRICSENLGGLLWHEEKIFIVKSEKSLFVKLRYKKTREISSEILPVCTRFAYLFDEKVKIKGAKLPAFNSRMPVNHLTGTYK